SMLARQDYQHLTRLFYQLEQIKPEGTFTSPVHYKEIFSGAYKRELLVFITDFYETDGEITKLLDTLLSLGHEIIVFHLLSKNELDLDFKGYATFEDLETGNTIQIDQGKARAAYLEKMANHLEKTRAAMLDRRIYYRTLTTNTPLDE